jgi:uncharacterized membrane protein
MLKRLTPLIPKGKKISQLKTQKGTLLDNLIGIKGILRPNEALDVFGSEPSSSAAAQKKGSNLETMKRPTTATSSKNDNAQTMRMGAGKLGSK